MLSNRRIFPFIFFSIIIILCFAIAIKTWHDIKPINPALRTIISDAQTLQVTDRNGYPLSISYQNRWNTYDYLPLYQIPDFLKQAFIASEDQHFYSHHGIDWQARLGALWQNLRAQHRVRGASTISEQVVRMIHPRPRTLWSKWLETFEVLQLDQQVKKADILEFYLNQIPYASNRRGVLQGAHYYFNRDLNTLNHKEMLALVVLTRAPSNFDLYHNVAKINNAINRLAVFLQQRNLLNAAELDEIKKQQLVLDAPQLPINAAHFINFVRSHNFTSIPSNRLQTTLDANLQQQVQAMLDARVNSLAAKNVHNAAVLVADHTTGEILAWVVSGANSGLTPHPQPGYQIDAVTTPRQPGSALKPFLYALALESGWSPATLIDDSPLSIAVGVGLHRFKNYSNTYYGPISLREALGNSLNIPALRTAQFVGPKRYLDTLHALGFSSLNRDITVYDEGLALGNGEVTLLELVTGYSALANRGVYSPLHFLFDTPYLPVSTQQIFTPEAASLIGNILSDSWARRLEFGTNSVLNLPIQTAVKTGTSTDYRDAWVVGFNYRYIVGIWMGNLDRTPMGGITGSTGPALVMREIFSTLNKYQTTAPLYLSPKLVRADICTKVADDPCFLRSEYFMSGTEPGGKKIATAQQRIALVRPTDNLQIAIDPRVPLQQQKLAFQIDGMPDGGTVEWILDDQSIAHTTTGQYLWQLQRGKHTLRAVVSLQNHTRQQIPEIQFWVK